MFLTNEVIRFYRQVFVVNSLFGKLNSAVVNHLRTVEMIGVIMRIISFSLVSWMGPASPFIFVWAFNTVDAVLLTWCAIIRKDTAYTVLNVFWIGVGMVGLVRALNPDMDSAMSH
jgi:hypothetical protein